MDEFIKMLNEYYELVRYKIKETKIIFEVASSNKSCTCPYCCMLSSGVHSNYQREIQDLPILNKQTILLVNTRKMFCDNPDCKVSTFAELRPFVVKNRAISSKYISCFNAAYIFYSILICHFYDICYKIYFIIR